MILATDLQMVEISLRVLTRPDTRYLPKIYRTLGTDYDERVLPSIVNEVLKGVVAQYNAASLLTNRETVSLTIRRNLTERAKEFNIIMEDVSITELHFGHEFTQAVEAKQVGASCCGATYRTVCQASRQPCLCVGARAGGCVAHTCSPAGG